MKNAQISHKIRKKFVFSIFAAEENKILKKWFCQILFCASKTRVRHAPRYQWSCVQNGLLRPPQVVFYENSWLFTWKMQKRACKNIKRWYIIFPLRLMMVRYRADITREKLFLKRSDEPQKNEEISKKLLAKFKKCGILCFCCASKTMRQQGW